MAVLISMQKVFLNGDFIDKDSAKISIFDRGFIFGDGIYEVDLPTDKLFEKVYGKLQVKFSVRNDVAIIEDIVPNDILLACYEKEVPTYKGIPYDTEKDLAKIKIMEKLI